MDGGLDHHGLGRRIPVKGELPQRLQSLWADPSPRRAALPWAAAPEPPWSPRSGSILPGSRTLGVVKEAAIAAAILGHAWHILIRASSGAVIAILTLYCR